MFDFYPYDKRIFNEMNESDVKESVSSSMEISWDKLFVDDDVYDPLGHPIRVRDDIASVSPLTLLCTCKFDVTVVLFEGLSPL